MAIRATHDLHARRLSRNVGLALVLVAFVALVFALTVVKVTQGDRMHANDGKKNSGVFIDQTTQPTTKGGTQP